MLLMMMSDEEKKFSFHGFVCVLERYITVYDNFNRTFLGTRKW